MHQQLSAVQLIRSLGRTYQVTSVSVYTEGLGCPLTPGVTSQIQESHTSNVQQLLFMGQRIRSDGNRKIFLLEKHLNIELVKGIKLS